MLEFHVRLCVTEPDLLKKYFCSKSRENRAGSRPNLLNFLKNFVINVFWIWSKVKSISFFMLLHISNTWLVRYGQKCSQPIRLQDSLQYKISRKKWGIEMNFCMKTNIKIACKLILLLLVGVATHAQYAQHNKFATSLQYLIKEMRDKANVLHEYKTRSFLQIDAIICGGNAHVCLKYPN